MPGSVFPSSDLAFIQFCEQRTAAWSAQPEQLGLTSQMATEFVRFTESAHDAFDAADLARQQARNATRTLRDAIKALRTAGGNDVKAIRNFAERQPDPNKVYNIAMIPGPSPRTPTIPPIAPTEINARLDTETGGLTIRWKVTQPKGISGVVYRIERNTGTGQAWQLAGLVGGKTFVDDNVPTTQTVQYRIIAQRGNLASNPSQTLVINFGTGPGMTFSVTTAEQEHKKAPKLAA